MENETALNQETTQIQETIQTNAPEQHRGSITIATAAPIAPVSTEESKWMYDENTAGVGEKPEWFNEKTFKNVAEQAKSAVELRKALGERTGSPDEYAVDLKEFGENYKDC